MRTLFRQAWLETKLFVRRRDDVFWTLAFPMFFIVLFGLVYGDMHWEEFGIRAIDYILPGIVVMAVMVTGVMATATGFAEEREKGIYRRFALTPLRRSLLIGGQILHRYLLILTQTALLLVLGHLAFGVRIAGGPASIWLVLTLGGLCFLSIGFLLAGFVQSARAATGISMIVFFLLLFLGGIFFPPEMLPAPLAAVSRALPSALLNESLRSVMVEGTGIGTVWIEILAITGWFAGAFSGAVLRVRWE